jgi:folate-binding protein YgfZ
MESAGRSPVSEEAGPIVPEPLATGRSFADLSFWRKVTVRGGDAGGWLNDLVSADLAELEPGRATRSLLLSPTGRVRADFTVAMQGEAFLLIQDPSQPRPIDELLAPFLLSSDVSLDDRTEELALFAFPALADPPTAPGAEVWSPSCLGGGEGLDLFAPGTERDRLLRSLGESFAQAGNEEVEAWRIAAGIPRFGVDVFEDDLPQEGGMDDAIAFDKGCYLGQEAIAKVRNLGHPRRLVIPLEAEGAVSPGDPLEADGIEVGEATSVAQTGGRTLVLARVKWEAREGPLRTGTGVPLSRRDRD